MKKLYLYIVSALCLAACQEKDYLIESFNEDAVELTGVETSIYGGAVTRAAALDKDNYVGRKVFEDGDNMVLTTIKRTADPSKSIASIPSFTYHDLSFNYAVASGQTSGSWTRNEQTGWTEDDNTKSKHPDRIYWSDAEHKHTYIGYSVPKQSSSDVTFDWNMRKTYEGSSTDGIDTYYGSLSDPTLPQSGEGTNITNYIDHTDNIKIKYDDLLLTYDDQKVAETGGSVAKLYYHHALANVRVVVNISGFSSTSESADARSVVEDMILKNMLTMYKWKQQSYGAQALDANDQDKLTGIYQNPAADHSVPTWDQKKDTHLWIPRKEGTGTGVGRQFVFYGLAVPTTMAANSLELKFTVKYQDPMDPWEDKEQTKPNMKAHTYTAKMDNAVEFRAGWCTTINISLNHQNEKMTVGAEYMDWQYIDTPDEGELKKNSTFLSTVHRDSVTIFGDKTATVDDATWLYIDETPTYTDNGKTYYQHSLRDIYGHYGTEEDPFIITTADQLLSFAYEVNGTSRKSSTYFNIVKNQKETLTEGAPFDFTGYHVKLDANMTMQPNTNILHEKGQIYTVDSNGNKTYTTPSISWPGIGDTNHMFNGMFDGGFRHVNLLYGRPLFTHIGPEGIIDHIFITDAIGINGSGSIAEVNDGIICGSHVEGDIVDNTNVEYCGSIVGVNNGVLIACSHIGSIEGNATILGALLGQNNGIMVTCYNVGDAKNNKKDSEGKSCPAYAGVGDFAVPKSVAYCCYFNKDFYTSQDYTDLQSKIGHVAFPLTTSEMQSNKYVNQAALDNPTDDNTGEITDVSIKTDMFYCHWSLNTGLNRAIAYLTDKLAGTPDTSTNDIEFHAPGTSDTDQGVERVTLKKSQVEWLVNHFAKVKTDGGKTELEFTHKFQFIPGTYPKLQ